MRLQSAIAAAAFSVVAQAQQTAWGQCGGQGWSGNTICVSGYVCTFSNDYFSQCLPGTSQPGTTATIPASTAAPPNTTTAGTATPPQTTLKTVSDLPTTTVAGPSSTTISGPVGSGPGTTLQSGYYWIRAVASPNFHQYMQTNPVYTTGLAILESYTSAGQFQVVDGQLVELIDGGLLYAVVSPAADTTETKLALSFSTSKNTYGTFEWSGDALTWTVAGISRPNSAAWLVCADQQLFINLGSYGYMTPEGCSDQTIHYYNDSTANA